MTSIYTNSSALSMLRELSGINDQLATSVERIATSRTINSAADGVALWSFASQLESDIGLGETLIQQLDLADAALSTAQSGLTSAYDTLSNIRDQLVLASVPGADRASIQSEIDGLIASLQAGANGANLGNIEILDQSASGSYNPVKSFVSTITTSGGATSVTTIDLDVRGVALLNANADTGILEESHTVNATTSTVLDIDISALTDAAGDLQEIADLIDIVDTVMGNVTTAATTVGGVLNRVETQSSVVQTLNSARETALTSMVGADLEAEAAAQDALLARQQLAIEALAIHNASLSSILRLFQ